MNRANARCLYAVEPITQRMHNWLVDAIRMVIGFYWFIFKVWGHFLLGGIALALVVCGGHDLYVQPRQAFLSVPGVLLGTAFFVSHRVRHFAWVTFGLFLVWFVPVTAVFMQFTDPTRPVASWLVRAGIVLFYVCPPLLGAAIITHVENESRPRRHPRWTRRS